MQRFTRFQPLVFGSTGLGRVVRMALSAVTVQAVMAASAFGQQAGDDPSTPAGQPVAALNRGRCTDLGVYIGMCTSGPGVPPQTQSNQDAYQQIVDNNPYQQMLNRVRNDPNVYNNPFAPNGHVSLAPVPDARFQPGAGAPVGMSQDQFRASVNQSMQQFRQADAQSRQGSGQQPFPGTGSAAGPGATVGASTGQQSAQRIGFDDNAPRNTSTGQGPQQYAPRNGYDSQGNRADSTRPRFEPQGNPQSSPAPVTPNVPAVSQRAYGTQSQTAALHFPGI